MLSAGPLALVAGLAGPLAYSLDTAATSHTGALPAAGPSVTSFGGPGGGFAGGRPGAGFGRQGGTTGGGTTGARSTARRATGGGTAPGGTGQPGSGAPGGQGGGIGGGLGGSTQVSSATTKLLTSGATGYRWAAATVGAESAAPFQLASGEPIMAIGGFNGTDQSPTLAQFKKMVTAHEVHYFIGANGHSFGGGSGDASQITAWVQSHFTKQTAGGETVYNLARPSRS